MVARGHGDSGALRRSGKTLLPDVDSGTGASALKALRTHSVRQLIMPDIVRNTTITIVLVENGMSF